MQFDFFSKFKKWTIEDSSLAPSNHPASVQNGDSSLTMRARELLHGLGCLELAARVSVRWNPRMRTTAGVANYRASLVTLNPMLVQFGEDEIDKTLRHELAHLLAHQRAGRRRILPHGAEWKMACSDLGMPEEKRCHNLPLPRRRVTAKHNYLCPACKSDIKRVRPFRRKVACFSCCRAHNRGRYHEKFRLVKVPVPDCE